jgi:hypothetical protein
MKRHNITTSIMTTLLIATMILPAMVFGQNTPAVAGTGAADYPAGTLFAGTLVNGLEFGMGVFVPGDGSATGQVSVTLPGLSVLGQPIEIEFDGEATSGVINADGSGTVMGIGALSLGNGLPALTDVPYTVTATQSTVSLVINGISLPVVALNIGKITIQ